MLHVASTYMFSVMQSEANDLSHEIEDAQSSPKNQEAAGIISDFSDAPV